MRVRVSTDTPSDRKRLLWNVLFTFLVSGAASQPLGSLIPFLRDSYGISYEFSGILLSSQSAGNLFATFITGFLPIYLGRRKSILVTSVWMMVGYLLLISGIGAPWLLLTACVMTGIAKGSNCNFANTMISTLPGDEATKGFNLSHGGYAIGAFLSPLVLVACNILWPEYGWRIAGGILFLLAGVQFLVFARMPLPVEKQTGSLQAVDKSFLKNIRFWLGTAMLFFYISTEYAIVGWMVTYFQDIGVLSENVSQIMNSLLWAVIFGGRMVGAAVSGKVSKSKLLIADGIGFFLCFLLVFFSRTPGVIVAGIAGVGLFMATIYPTAFAIGSECVKGNDLGCSTISFVSSIGGIVAPAVVGMVAQRAGISAGMAVVVACTALLLTSIVLSIVSIAKDAKR